MDDNAIAALKAAYEASTDGEWETSYSGFGLWVVSFDNEIIAKFEYHADAAFIVAAHETLPALLAEVEKLRAENAELQKNLEMSKFALAQFGLQIYNPSDADAP